MHDIPGVAVTDLPDPLPEDLHVLDVREPAEWAHGHIEGAHHVPLLQLPARVSDVPDCRVLVVSTIGGRSSQVVGYLRARGVDAVNLDGGMLEWTDAGRPVVASQRARVRVV